MGSYQTLSPVQLKSNGVLGINTAARGAGYLSAMQKANAVLAPPPGFTALRSATTAELAQVTSRAAGAVDLYSGQLGVSLHPRFPNLQ